MKNWTTLIYLFFLDRNEGENRLFNSELLYYQKFLYDNKSYNWRRLFRVNGLEVKDLYSNRTILNLKFHKLVDDQGRLTDRGHTMLNELLSNNPSAENALLDFISSLDEYRYDLRKFQLNEQNLIAFHIAPPKKMNGLAKHFSFLSKKTPLKSISI